MEFVTLFLGVFGAMVSSYKIVRAIRRDDTPKQEVGLWMLFASVSLLAIYIWGP